MVAAKRATRKYPAAAAGPSGTQQGPPVAREDFVAKGDGGTSGAGVKRSMASHYSAEVPNPYEEDIKPDLKSAQHISLMDEAEMNWAQLIRKGYEDNAKMGQHGKGKQIDTSYGASAKTVEVCRASFCGDHLG